MLCVYPSIKLLSAEALAKFTELGRGEAKMHTQVSSSDAEPVPSIECSFLYLLFSIVGLIIFAPRDWEYMVSCPINNLMLPFPTFRLADKPRFLSISEYILFYRT